MQPEWVPANNSACTYCKKKEDVCIERLSMVKEYYMTLTMSGKRYFSMSNFKDCTVLIEMVPNARM